MNSLHHAIRPLKLPSNGVKTLNRFTSMKVRNEWNSEWQENLYLSQYFIEFCTVNGKTCRKVQNMHNKQKETVFAGNITLRSPSLAVTEAMWCRREWGAWLVHLQSFFDYLNSAAFGQWQTLLIIITKYLGAKQIEGGVALIGTEPNPDLIH